MLKMCHRVYTEQELKSYSTHTLIRILHHITGLYTYYKESPVGECTDCKDYKECWKKLEEERILNEIRLRKELATRPHIPNKKESRKIRQDRAKYRYGGKSVR